MNTSSHKKISQNKNMAQRLFHFNKQLITQSIDSEDAEGRKELTGYCSAATGVMIKWY
jgi:hypothetical protein